MRAFAFLLLLFCPVAVADAPKTVAIGVLSHRGDAATFRAWSATAEYIGSQLPGYRFEIVPLDFDDVEPAVAAADVDFVLVNPGIYVALEVEYRVSRLATLNNRRNDAAYNIFGGVVFTRADRADINELTDLVGSDFMAVDATSLGGFQMAWGEFNKVDIDPERDLGSLRFGGTHDEVVMAVLEGRVDAATVRTDILERMASDGRIRLEDFKVINQQQHAEFPFLNSTRLYPEWPFSKVHHTPNKLAQQVAVALLSMPPDHAAALAGRYAGWTVPLDYQPVHDLFKELGLPPYEPPQVTLLDVLRAYWPWLLAGIGALMFTVAMSIWVLKLNRRLERARMCLEQQHNLILNSVGDGIYGVDLQGNSTFVNRAMERMTGWRSDELIGRNQHELLHHTRGDGSPHPGHDCPVYATFRDNEARYVADDVFWRRDGSSFPVEYSSNPIEDDRGRVIGAVVVFRDITERRQAEERLRQHQLELAHVSRLSTMGEMASGIAHEVNQPLSAITNYTRGCIRMLQGGIAAPEQLLEVMERVAAQAERAGEIIRQLRQFIRKEEPRKAVVSLNRLIEELAGFVGPEARRGAVSIRLELEAGDPQVQVHAIQIEQVMLNLARNAIEAMQEVAAGRRSLSFRTLMVGSHVAVEVEDRGPGLADEVADTVFEPFVTTKKQGMGLGLSISRGIIEAHQGTLTVDSHRGEGTTFRFTLPLHESENRRVA